MSKVKVTTGRPGGEGIQVDDSRIPSSSSSYISSNFPYRNHYLEQTFEVAISMNCC